MRLAGGRPLHAAPVVAGDVRSGLRAHLQHSPVDGPARPGYVGGLRGGEESDDRGDLPGVAGRPSGTPGLFAWCGSWSSWPVMGVAISPGATQLAVTWYCPSSRARVFIRPPRPCLAAS